MVYMHVKIGAKPAGTKMLSRASRECGLRYTATDLCAMSETQPMFYMKQPVQDITLHLYKLHAEM